MRFFKLLTPVLNLFGEGGGDGTAAGGESGTQGETTAAPQVPTRPGKKAGEYDNVIFGKQDDTAPEATGTPDAGEKPADVKVTSDTLEARRQAYYDLVNGEYKDLYTEDTQRIINKRFKETAALKEQAAKTAPILEALAAKYGIESADLDALGKMVDADKENYFNDAAEKAGLTVEQYTTMQTLKRQNAEYAAQQRRQEQQAKVDAQMAEWATQADAAKQKYPDLDLATEARNKDFTDLLKRGLSVQKAYEVVHMDEIMSQAVTSAAKTTEQKIVNNIRAKGNRPVEAGVSPQSAFTVKDDPSKMSKKDRAEAIRRAAAGETIRF